MTRVHSIKLSAIPLYKNKINELLATGKAYPCMCTAS